MTDTSLNQTAEQVDQDGQIDLDPLFRLIMSREPGRVVSAGLSSVPVDFQIFTISPPTPERTG